MFWQSVLHLPNSIQLNIEYLCWCPKITMSFYVARGKLVGHQQRCFFAGLQLNNQQKNMYFTASKTCHVTFVQDICLPAF